jgi:retron-type reverse transcriptase
MAYMNLYANTGAMTVGTDPHDTIDGMSLKRIHNLAEELKHGTFQWKPVRRVYIKKANGKLRPLGIPGWKDKMVQEAMRLILNAYYEPQFSTLSHGFRPQRSCHTALDQVGKTWTGTKWFIEGTSKVVSTTLTMTSSWPC